MTTYTQPRAFSLPKDEAAWERFVPNSLLLREQKIDLPSWSELDVIRHFSALSKKNVGIDNIFYPLGSCTMKLNLKVCELIAQFESFQRAHPLSAPQFVQGCLEVIDDLIKRLSIITGMDGGSLQPNAGAQGEFVGVSMIRAYHLDRQDFARDEFLIPDNAHGTNPATAAMAGFKIVELKTNEKGDIDLADLEAKLSSKTAGLMLTNPNTLGLFSSAILEISKKVHEVGGLLYYDGANLNPLLMIASPGDMGFDVMHINLHKTFATPHGGGGPGAGPVFCKEKLVPFLPLGKKSIGQIASFWGNFAIYLRAYVYILIHGSFGLRQVAEMAVLNANYLKAKLAPFFTIPFKKPCMHEFVVQVDNYPGIRAQDIAKRLLDFGVHAPTVYFPLIIKECMLIEPTETESKATLDHFVEIIQLIVDEIHANPLVVTTAPHTLAVTRLDEVRAAKNLILVNKIQ